MRVAHVAKGGSAGAGLGVRGPAVQSRHGQQAPRAGLIPHRPRPLDPRARHRVRAQKVEFKLTATGSVKAPRELDISRFGARFGARRAAVQGRLKRS